MQAALLAQNRIFCSEKMVLKLGFMLMAIAVFSVQNMPTNAYGTNDVLKGYIQENTIYKEQSDEALFLLQKKWEAQLKEKYGNHEIKKIEKGIVYVSMVKYINSRRVKINIAEINRNINKNLEIIPSMSSDKMHSKSKINNIAAENNAVIAINGSYFKQDTGTPLGAIVINNEIITGPIYERAGLGISENGFKISSISFDGKLETEYEQIKVDNINQPRMMFSQVLMYTSKWGVKSPVTQKPAVHISIKNNRVTAKSDYPLIIPEDGCVISAPKEILKNVQIGDEVKVSYGLNPKWEDINHIISGGPYLLKEGNIFVDTKIEKLNSITGKNPRTAIGYTKDNVLIMVTVDGRKEGSDGMTLDELAVFMKNLGCYEAINLDGGSSTVMYVDGKIYTGSNLKTSASINNALVIRRKT